VEWTAAIARAVINPRHGVYEAQDGHFMERTHLPLKLHLPASVTIGGCMSKEAIEQKEVIVGKLKDSTSSDDSFTTQNRSSGIDDDIVLDSWMSLHAL
jgi:hypothetical protein